MPSPKQSTENWHLVKQINPITLGALTIQTIAIVWAAATYTAKNDATNTQQDKDIVRIDAMLTKQVGDVSGLRNDIGILTERSANTINLLQKISEDVQYKPTTRRLKNANTE